MIVMIGSGLLLQSKKHWGWVQPAEDRGTGTRPGDRSRRHPGALGTVPGMNVQSWDDVNRLDVRPGRGMVKAWLMNGYEVQVDLGTGRVLQTAYRRSDLIETIHDGSFFARRLDQARAVPALGHRRVAVVAERHVDVVGPVCRQARQGRAQQGGGAGGIVVAAVRARGSYGTLNTPATNAWSSRTLAYAGFLANPSHSVLNCAGSVSRFARSNAATAASRRPAR